MIAGDKDQRFTVFRLSKDQLKASLVTVRPDRVTRFDVREWHFAVLAGCV